MSSAAPVAGGGALAGKSARKPARIWVAHGLFALLLVGYLISLVVRSADAYSTAVDGWGVDGWELALCAMAFYRAFTRRQGRALSLALGSSMLAWSLGDIALTIESLGGASPPTPSLADAFYVAFYPLAYLGLVLLLRRESSKLVPASWLDGAVAGLGAAALCAAFAFDRIMHLSGGGGVAATATNVAYPVGDVLLLAMAVGGSAVLAGSGAAPGGGRAGWRWSRSAIPELFQALVNPPGSDRRRRRLASAICSCPPPWGGPGPPTAGPRAAPGFLLPGWALPPGSASCWPAALASQLGGHRAGRGNPGGGRHPVDAVGREPAQADRAAPPQAITDQLTGLGNRRRLASVWTVLRGSCGSETDARRLAFLFVDLDQSRRSTTPSGTRPTPAADQDRAALQPAWGRMTCWCGSGDELGWC